MDNVQWFMSKETIHYQGIHQEVTLSYSKYSNNRILGIG